MPMYLQLQYDKTARRLFESVALRNRIKRKNLYYQFNNPEWGHAVRYAPTHHFQAVTA